MIQQVGIEAAANASKPDAAKTKQAAEQFEAVLIGQLLRSMRESASGGWLGTGEDAAGDSMMEVAEEHLSAVMAAQGGIGLATLVTQGIEDAQAKHNRSATEAAASTDKTAP